MDAADVVRAKRFELVDDDGNVRVALSAEPNNGMIGLHVSNSLGVPIVSVGVEPGTDSPYIILRRSLDEAAGVALTVMPTDGTPVVHLKSEQGADIVLSIAQDGATPSLYLKSSDGTDRQIFPEP